MEFDYNKHRYEVRPPAVVNDEMLRKAVNDQGPKDEAGKLIAMQEGIEFGDVTKLQLDFRNILHIQNLWQFTSLTKLQMDNNIIEKIQNLDELVNLTWLDLSFNRIKMIEGLDKLTKLQDLSLFKNNISRIENLDTLTQLDVLSIGCNNISEESDLVYLRKLENIKAITMKGNPVCDALDVDYKIFLLAHLPRLVYIEYRLVDEEMKKTAASKFQYQVEELKFQEKQQEEKGKREVELDNKIKQHKEAYVDRMNGPHFFQQMWSEDVEGLKLKHMPGMDDIVERFEGEFVRVCKKMFHYGLQQHKKRCRETQYLREGISEGKADVKQDARKIIERFDDYKEKALPMIQSMTDPQAIETKMEEYHAEVSKMKQELMALESQLSDQIEETLNQFEHEMQELVSDFLENVQTHMNALRDMQSAYQDRILDVANAVFDKVLRNEIDELTLPEQLRWLMVDKETLHTAAQSSHDSHIQTIDTREDNISHQINIWLDSLVSEITDTEQNKRNRARITEINAYCDHLRDELDMLYVAALQPTDQVAPAKTLQLKVTST